MHLSTILLTLAYVAPTYALPPRNPLSITSVAPELPTYSPATEATSASLPKKRAVATVYQTRTSEPSTRIHTMTSTEEPITFITATTWVPGEMRNLTTTIVVGASSSNFSSPSSASVAVGSGSSLPALSSVPSSVASIIGSSSAESTTHRTITSTSWNVVHIHSMPTAIVTLWGASTFIEPLGAYTQATDQPNSVSVRIPGAPTADPFATAPEMDLPPVTMPVSMPTTSKPRSTTTITTTVQASVSHTSQWDDWGWGTDEPTLVTVTGTGKPTSTSTLYLPYSSSYVNPNIPTLVTVTGTGSPTSASTLYLPWPSSSGLVDHNAPTLVTVTGTGSPTSTSTLYLPYPSRSGTVETDSPTLVTVTGTGSPTSTSTLYLPALSSPTLITVTGTGSPTSTSTLYIPGPTPPLPGAPRPPIPDPFAGQPFPAAAPSTQADPPPHPIIGIYRPPTLLRHPSTNRIIKIVIYPSMGNMGYLSPYLLDYDGDGVVSDEDIVVYAESGRMVACPESGWFVRGDGVGGGQRDVVCVWGG